MRKPEQEIQLEDTNPGIFDGDTPMDNDGFDIEMGMEENKDEKIKTPSTGKLNLII